MRSNLRQGAAATGGKGLTLDTEPSYIHCWLRVRHPLNNVRLGRGFLVCRLPTGHQHFTTRNSNAKTDSI